MPGMDELRARSADLFADLALGGIAGLSAVIGGFLGKLGGGPGAAGLGGAALVIASALLAIAIIVRSDVITRSTAQAAEYQARGRIAATFLDTTATPVPGPAAPATTMMFIKPRGISQWCGVAQFGPDGRHEVVAVRKGRCGTRVPVDRVG